jgi:DNA-binding MarR family transcriptional regulator
LTPVPTQTPALQAWSALVAAYFSVLSDVVGRLEREARMDSGVFSALAFLDRAPVTGRMRLSELYDAMRYRYSQPGLSRLVQRMLRDGLVSRRPDPDDGRGAVVVTTRQGRARYRKANAVYLCALADHFGRHLGDDEAARLAEMLEVLVARRAAAGSAPSARR